MSHASCTRRPTPVSGHTQQPRTALQPANLPRTTGSLSALCLVSPFLLHSISLSLIYTLRISPFRSSFSSAQVVSQLFAAFLNVPPLFSFYGHLNHPLQSPPPNPYSRSHSFLKVFYLTTLSFHYSLLTAQQTIALSLNKTGYPQKCAVLDCYAACSGNCVHTFRHNLLSFPLRRD